MSGDMRLRQLILAIIALTGVWVALVIQRSHEPSALPIAVAARPHAPAPTASPKVRRIPGLDRPAAVQPIVKPSRKAHAHTPTPAPRPARRPVHAKRASKPPATGPAIDTSVVIPEDTRVAAVAPPPGLEPLAISDAQVVAITSSSARITFASVSASSALVASSRIRIGGFFRSARAIDRRWRSPPESERPRSPTLSAKP